MRLLLASLALAATSVALPVTPAMAQAPGMSVVDTAGGQNLSLAGQYFRTRANQNIHAILNIRIAGLADGGNTAVLQHHNLIGPAQGGARNCGRFSARPMAR